MSGAESRSSRVLVVEDDCVVAETLTLYLQQAGYSVEAVHDGPAGLARAQGPDVALVILDWMLPGISGHEVCRRLRSVSPVPILMLTARSTEDDRVRGLQGGADDYVAKPFSPREIVARVQALLRRIGRTPGTQPVAPFRLGSLEVDTWSRIARVDGRVVALTPTEFRLVEVLSSHPGRVFTRDELMGRAFGPDYEALDRTIDTHITNLRRKLDAGSAQRFVVTVHGVGYRLASEPR